MSDSEHIEPENPPAGELADRLFIMAIVGLITFIGVIFGYVIL